MRTVWALSDQIKLGLEFCWTPMCVVTVYKDQSPRELTRVTQQNVWNSYQLSSVFKKNMFRVGKIRWECTRAGGRMGETV